MPIKPLPAHCIAELRAAVEVIGDPEGAGPTAKEVRIALATIHDDGIDPDAFYDAMIRLHRSGMLPLPVRGLMVAALAWGHPLPAMTAQEAKTRMDADDAALDAQRHEDWVARGDQIMAHRAHVCGGYNEESITALSRPPAERRANAKLAAAAPDMLAALRGLLADKYLADSINADRMAAARAAVAKATA